MNIDYLIGLLLFFMVFRAIRAVLQSLRATGNPRTQSTGAPTAIYRSPRDLVARSVPASISRVASRLKVAATKPPTRLGSAQAEAPFITQRSRRFPILELLALAAFIALIMAAHALLTNSSRVPARSSDRAAQIDAPASSAALFKVLES